MKNEKGLTLIEVVIAIGILGIIGVAYLGGLANASKSLGVADERATAESLARSQMEYVKKQTYTGNGTYGIISNIPAGYTIYGYNESIPTLFGQRWDPVTGSVSASETGIQKITINVKHLGKRIITSSSNCTLEGYKGDHP